MNIKSIIPNPILPIEPKSRVEGNSRTKESADRDANGRQPPAEQELKRHLTDQEFAEAIKALEATPGLKANGLSVKVESQNDIRIIFIVDPEGKVVRRLTEAQLWGATRDKDRATGKFLDKAM